MDVRTAREADDIEDRGLPGEHDRTSREDTLRLWERAPNWYTIVELNRRFIEGRLSFCPSYDESVAQETDDFSGLLELHDYGLVSTNSCPGGEIDDSYQRAFLFFNIPTRGLQTTSHDALPNFVQALVASNEVYAHVRFQYYNALFQGERDSNISGLMRVGWFSNLPNIGDSAWDEEGWSYDEDDQGQACTFNFIQAMYPDNTTGDYRIQTCGSSFRDDRNPIRASCEADPLQISVVARGWGCKNIGELIKNLMDQAGILSSYGR